MGAWESLLSSATVGLSAQAIGGSGIHHPHDPSDLVRCVAQLQRMGRTVEHMATVSVPWSRLVPEWDRLVELLRHEVETSTNGRAPATYVEMRRVIQAGTSCGPCSATGRGDECLKCKGTGRRSGGRCRADYCFGGADFCRACRGNGFTIEEE